MSKKVLMDAFFNQFHEFMQQLMTAFPDDTDFPAYDAGVAMVQTMNPAMVITEFKKNVLPFKELLLTKNSDFFLKHTFSELEPDNTMEQIIEKLKTMWSTLSDSSKDSIWSYIINLVRLAERL